MHYANYYSVHSIYSENIIIKDTHYVNSSEQMPMLLDEHKNTTDRQMHNVGSKRDGHI